MDNTALVSVSSFYAEPITPLRLKLATLLFDDIQFMEEERPNWVESIAEFFGGETGLPAPVLAKLRSIWFCANPVKRGFSIYGDHVKERRGRVLSPEDVSPELRRAAYDVITPSDEEKNYENYKLTIYTLSEIRWWQEQLPKATFIGADYVERIIQKAASNSASILKSTALEFALPDFSKLTFGEILLLRDSGFLKHFRNKFTELSLANETERLLEHYYTAMEKLVDEVKPTVSASVVKGILSNIPIPIVNPMSVALAAQDVRKHAILKKNYGWIYFMREMKSLP